MRDKVLRLADIAGCAAIRVERKEGRKYVPVREFAPNMAGPAWACAGEDSAGGGGLYRFTAVDADGEMLGTHRARIAAEEVDLSDKDVMVSYLSQTNKQLMGLLSDMVQSVSANLKTMSAPALPAQTQDPVSGLLGGMISAYFMKRQAEQGGQEESGGAGGVSPEAMMHYMVNLPAEQRGLLLEQAQVLHQQLLDGEGQVAPGGGHSGKLGTKKD